MTTIVRKVTPSNPTLILNNVSTANAGNYQVIITNAYGSVTSSIVSLTIIGAPQITNQPQSLIVTNGNPAIFKVGASGLPLLVYQWYFNTNTAVSGGTNAALIFANTITNETGAYFCVCTMQKEVKTV